MSSVAAHPLRAARDRTGFAGDSQPTIPAKVQIGVCRLGASRVGTSVNDFYQVDSCSVSSTTIWIASSVVPRPRLNRIAPIPIGSGTRVANKTDDISTSSERHADPVNAASLGKIRLDTCGSGAIRAVETRDWLWVSVVAHRPSHDTTSAHALI